MTISTLEMPEGLTKCHFTGRDLSCPTLVVKSRATNVAVLLTLYFAEGFTPRPCSNADSASAGPSWTGEAALLTSFQVTLMSPRTALDLLLTTSSSWVAGLSQTKSPRRPWLTPSGSLQRLCRPEETNNPGRGAQISEEMLQPQLPNLLLCLTGPQTPTALRK